jgi:hypothetical protein
VTFRNKFFDGWRWSDDQRVWWRFLLAAERGRTIVCTVEVHGGDKYDEATNRYHATFRPYLRCAFLFGATLMIALPRFLLRWCGGKRYGVRFGVRDGFFSLYYGRETHDSSTDKSWHCHVPWQDKRMVRYRYFDLDATTVVREFYDERGRIPFDPQYKFEQSSDLPKRSYRLTDYDGETIYCTAYVKEMMWKHGTKWWRWLSWFVPNRVRKYVELEFCPAYGRKKHSWKGGTVGHSAEFCQKAKDLDDVVWWYCAEHEMKLEETLAAVYVPPPKPPAEPEQGACMNAVP